MKKLLVLLVVLGLVSAANAAVIDIQIASINGQPIAPVKEITIMPSDTIDLQITFTAPASEALFNLGVVIGGVHDATLSLASIVYDSAFDKSLTQVGSNFINVPANMAAGWGPVGTVEPKVVISEITIHCDKESQDLIVKLSDFTVRSIVVLPDAGGNEAAYTYGTGVLIHQVVPEPMTMMLLGLGSLFLVRRKK